MRWMVFQFVAASVFGCIGFLLNHPHPNSKVPLLAGLLFGFGGSYALMFLIAWARFGWRSARTMKLDGN